MGAERVKKGCCACLQYFFVVVSPLSWTCETTTAGRTQLFPIEKENATPTSFSHKQKKSYVTFSPIHSPHAPTHTNIYTGSPQHHPFSKQPPSPPPPSLPFPTPPPPFKNARVRSPPPLSLAQQTRSLLFNTHADAPSTPHPSSRIPVPPPPLLLPNPLPTQRSLGTKPRAWGRRKAAH